MVFKRSAFLLLAATAAAVATTEASDPQAQQKHAVETKHHGHKHHGKEVTEKQGDGENVKTYKHGQVHKAKGKGGDAAAAPAPVKKSHKKHAKQVAETTAPPTTKPTEAPEEDDEGSDGSDDTDDATVGTGDEADTEEQDFKLKVGEAVDIDVDGQKYTLEHFANGSTVIIYPNGTHQWVNNQDIYLDFETDGSSDDEAGSLSASGSGVGGSDVGDEDDTIVADDENGVSGIAKKFSEFATKITGGSLKGAAPVILVGSAIGALAAVVGIAVVAMRRARTNSAEEDPASVLADATEDVEAGAKKTEDKKDDEAADESKALDASESESESDESEQEAHFV